MMRLLVQRTALLLGAVLGLLGTRPATANAQKALVYCPVAVDATGCNAIVSALTGPAYPLGVDRGYDGTGGTVDLKAVDLFTYSVFVVPSLADGATSQPYALLRDPEVAEHLKAALIGRLAMWSGSPDQGATNRGMKDALIQNLAGWAGASFGTAKGPGLVALLDASASATSRYDWVRAITPVPVTSDPALLIYSAVRALNARATSILTSGAGPIAYDNMATFGFQVPNGAAGVSLDAVGQTGTSQGGQVVLLTMEAGNANGATVKTDKDDYAPGETVTITGTGWQAGETVKLTLHMDPLRDSDTELSATADGNGNFTNADFSPAAYDIGVRFVLTAVGQTSGRRAQTTFTDGPSDFGVDISPITATSGGSQSYLLRIWNASDNNNNPIGSANVTVPAGWTVTTPLATPTAAPNAKTWTASLVSGVIELRATANSQRLNRTNGSNPADTIKLVFTATAPVVGVATPYTWATAARDGITFSGGTLFTQTSANAVVTVSPPANAATTTTPSNAAATYGDASVNLTATVTSTSTVNTGTVTFTVKQGATTIGSATTSGTVTSGNASVSYALPTGTAAGPYSIQAVYNPGSGFSGSTGSATLTIAPKTVTPTVTVSNKVYDGTTAATILTRTLTGVLAADVPNVNLTGGTATFANKNVGTGKTVTITGLALSGSAAGNYQLSSTSASALADITVRTLAVSGTGVNKVYDATTAATVTLADDRVAGDVFTTSFTSATFADKNVGNAKPISVTGITITGTDAANYTANTSCTSAADITAKSVTGSFTANNKVYDGTTAATIATRSLTGAIVGDVVSLTGGAAAFADKNVGTGKTVNGTGFSLTGADAGNYSLVSSSLTATANVTARALTISATGVNKVYDGTATATVTLSDNRVSGDVFTDSHAAATFNNKNVGAAKPVSVSGISISGTDAGNYTFNATANTTADITARALTVSATGQNKVYDGNTNATVTLADDRVAGDVLTTAYTTATFDTKNVGTGKTVNVSGISISGTDAGNYTFNATATAIANITARALVVTATGVNKVYDGTTAATVTLADDRVSGDVFTTSYTSATFNNKNVGTAKPVSVSGIALGGTDAGNYTQNTTANTTADITQRALTVSATGVDKVYDATTAATVTLSDNRVAGDVFTDSYTSATFADKNVGTGKAVSVSGIAIAGADAPNYTFNMTAATTANITAATVVGSFTASDKVYDRTTAAAISGRSLTGTLLTDNLSLTGGTASFADKNVGTNKTVTGTGFSLSGADAGNYVLQSTTLTTTASITARALVVSATGVNKVYDATTAATVTLSDDRISGDVFTDSYTSATFADKNVGTGKAVSVSGVSISGGDAINYTANTTAATTADITQFTLTGHFTANDKVYDGTDAAAIASRTLTIVFAGDVVSLTGGTATFADKNVGTNKTVTGTGFSLTGTDAPNYVLASTTLTTTASITQRALTVTATGVNKVYDGTTTATVTLSDNRVSGDVFTDSYASATFNTKNVGAGKPISVNGISISGTDAANYTFNTTTSASADITARTLTVTAAGTNKVYDGTTAATVTLSDDRVSGDVFTDSYTSATFADKNAGTGKTVTVTGISISGTDAGNYTFNTSTTTTADITKRALTISATGVNKVYDGTDLATVTLSDDRLSGDVFTDSYVAATFNNKNVGTAKPVSVTGISISGADAGNYTFNTTASTNADISPRALTITAAGVNKVYDATTAATVTLSDNRVAGDVLTDSYTSATFGDKNVGTAKPISVSGISISGADAGNYTFNTAANTTADITQATLTGHFTAANKVYDGNTAAAITGRTLTGVLGTDNVSLIGGTATFADKNVGTGKMVTGVTFSLSGGDAGNYVLASTTLTTTADITARVLTVSATGINKVYDGTTSATVTLSDDRVSGDALSTAYASASFDTKNVGTGKTVNVSGISISGTDAGNYTFNTTANTTADITARALTVSATGVNKVYDGNATATVTLSDNRVVGDVFTDSYASANFSDKNVGTGKTVSVSGISISGTDAGNYTFNTTASTTADITARPLSVTATGVNKVYDGTTAATVTFADNRVAGDVFTVTGSASFADKNVGTGKSVSVSGIALSGTDAGNYSHNTSTSTTADITARTLTVSATGVNKVYDGTNAATVTLSDDRVSGDVFTDSYTAASFADKNAGTAKTVTVTGISISGADAGNYTFNTSTTTTADITKRALTVTATGVNKIYDGTTTATVTLADNRVAGDVLTDNYAAANFSDKNVGTAKPISVSGISISGTDAGNYTFNTTAPTTADITQRSLTITSTGVDRVYDGTTNATVTLNDNRVPGDVFTDIYTSASFTDKNVGVNKPVSVSGISISGADAGNYTVNTTASTTATITAKQLTVSATGIDKVYDGNATATVSLSDDRVAGDVLSVAYTSASFNNKTVGTNKPVNVSGISVTGTDAGNYTYNATASTTASITARPLTISATGVNKVYDGTTSATVVLADNRVSGDMFTTTYSAAFNSKNVGTGKPVTVTGIAISGPDAGNYSANTSTSTTADITTRVLTVSASAQNKIYDGNATATVTLSDDRVADDVFSVTNTSAGFSDKNVGTGKTVTVNGIAISGADAANYTFNTTATTTANITSRPLAVTASGQNKVYDGNTTAVVTLSDDRVSGDVFTASYTSALFSDKNVGTGKTVTVSGIALSGMDAGNYTPNASTTTTADITARALTVSAVGIDKVYDGTTAATVTLSDNRVVGDMLTTAYAAAAFADKNVGTAKPVSVSGITVTGADASNYTFNATASTTANITPKQLTIQAAGVNKTYDGNSTATVNLSDDRVAGDVFTDNYAGAAFNNKNVGAGKPVSVSGISITGADAGNYTANTTASASADITKRTLTISATAANKIYDANTTATATLSDDRVSGDVFTNSYTNAAFNNANVANAKPVSVTGVSISGADAGNYAFNSIAATAANITPRSLIVTANNQTKIAGAMNPALTGTVTGSQGTDNISATYSTTATTASLPGTYPITPATVDPNGKIGNYAVTLNNGTLTVTVNAKPVLGTFTGPLLPVALGASVNISIPFTDVDVAASQPYTATIDWGNSTTSVTHPTTPGTISDTKTYPTPGVYTVKVTVGQDNFPLTHFDTKTYEFYVVVYDPNGGFVTGGGWIDSPVGACKLAPCTPQTVGKANFGFVSKYKKGQITPDGNTEFQFKAGDINFHSEVYEWLVVAGAKAQFKGTGTINGSGNYGFMLTAVDGQISGGGGADKFRIKIWDKNNADAIVYDNQLLAPDDATPTTLLGGGSINIQAK